MPLIWRRGQNPYRLNYFGILQVGAHASRVLIRFSKGDLAKKIGLSEYKVDGQVISKTDLDKAETELLDSASWASEVLLVHPRPMADEERLSRLLTAVDEATAPGPKSRPFALTDPVPLAPLIPPLHEAELPRPYWADLPVPAPDSQQDRNADIQFDL